jgi:hypothetical protein
VHLKVAATTFRIRIIGFKCRFLFWKWHFLFETELTWHYFPVDKKESQVNGMGVMKARIIFSLLLLITLNSVFCIIWLNKFWQRGLRNRAVDKLKKYFETGENWRNQFCFNQLFYFPAWLQFRLWMIWRFRNAYSDECYIKRDEDVNLNWGRRIYIPVVTLSGFYTWEPALPGPMTLWLHQENSSTDEWFSAPINLLRGHYFMAGDCITGWGCHKR